VSRFENGEQNIELASALAILEVLGLAASAEPSKLSKLSPLTAEVKR
jgi:hypothetical protein